MEEYRKGDRVALKFEGVVDRVCDDGLVVIDTIDEQRRFAIGVEESKTTLTLIERGDDPANDPTGTLRGSRVNALPYVKVADGSWVSLTTGTHHTCRMMNADENPIIGSVLEGVQKSARAPRVFQHGEAIPADVTAFTSTSDREIAYRVAEGWWFAKDRATAGYESEGEGWIGVSAHLYPVTEVIE